MNYREAEAAVLHYAYGRLIDTFSDKQVREAAARAVGAQVAHLLPSLTVGQGMLEPGVAERFRTDGVLRFTPFLSREQCVAILRHLGSLPVFDNQSHHDSSGTPYDFETARHSFPVAAYRVVDILQAPHLLAAMLAPQILELAEQYLGCMPTLYGTNLYWSFPGHEPVRGVQYFHRDFDDLKFVTLFILINDVDEQGGAHDFIPGSHLRDVNIRCFEEWQRSTPADPNAGAMQAQFRDPQILFAMNPVIDPLIEQVFAGRIRRLSGPAGTTFAEDNFGYHRGVRPARPRLLFWARYGYGANAYSARVRYQRVPASSLSARLPTGQPGGDSLKYLTRMLIDWDS